MKVEVKIGDGRKKPKLTQLPDQTWVVSADPGFRAAAYMRGVWVKVYNDPKDIAVDGKGLLIGPTGKLTKG